MSSLDYTVNVFDFLKVDTFHNDLGHPHIVMKDNPDTLEFNKVVMACPAARYQYTKDGEKKFFFADCLECGTCRMLVGDTILEKWQFPAGGKGVQYNYG